MPFEMDPQTQKILAYCAIIVIAYGLGYLIGKDAGRAAERKDREEGKK